MLLHITLCKQITLYKNSPHSLTDYSEHTVTDLKMGQDKRKEWVMFGETVENNHD